MSRVVVDTDVVSFLFKRHPFAFQYLPDLANRTALISFMTVAELDRWVLQARRDGSGSANIWNPSPYDRALCTKWAEITVAAQSRGLRIDCADAWIAATALLCDAPLITHNNSNYLGVPGLSLISHAQ